MHPPEGPKAPPPKERPPTPLTPPQATTDTSPWKGLVQNWKGSARSLLERIAGGTVPQPTEARPLSEREQQRVIDSWWVI